MSAGEWAIVIAAFGTVVIQVIGRLQAWQLAVIALRSERKAESTSVLLSEKMRQVHQTVDGTTSKLTDQLAALAKENSQLREQVAAYRERDATTAQLAREHNQQ